MALLVFSGATAWWSLVAVWSLLGSALGKAGLFGLRCTRSLYLGSSESLRSRLWLLVARVVLEGCAPGWGVLRRLPVLGGFRSGMVFIDDEKPANPWRSQPIQD